MRVKPSKFNFMYKKGSDTVVYNTFTKACVLLDEDNIDLVSIKQDLHAASSDTVKYLKENGFLVDDDFDEISFLKYYNYKVRFAEDYLSLTIAPTLSCNFDCPYCFENKRGGVMNEDVQDKIIEFLEDKLKHGVKRMDLTWYGGEPLLCFEIIKSLCDKINKLMEKYSVKCKMGMISNGYLLNEKIVDFLEENNISFQITIDGMEDNHNARRYLQGGTGTFSKLVENLHLFDGRVVDIYVRMNVDKYNQCDYSKLSQLVKSYNNPHMILYPAITENVNERKESRKSYYISDNVYDDFISVTRQKGLFHENVDTVPISNDVSKVPDNRSYFCAAELENSFVIDDKGNVYKCWNEVGKDNYCFNITNPDKINFKSLLNYMGDVTFTDDKCKECVFLPICFGGCKYHRANFGRYACAFNEKSLQAYIEDTLL